MKEKLINWLIKALKVDTNKITDGYHTFEELYEHRCLLWVKLLNYSARSNPDQEINWKSIKHSDGSVWDGWFIAGHGIEAGDQITYHLPMRLWEKLEVKERLTAPPYDGHTPQDVIKRLQ